MPKKGVTKTTVKLGSAQRFQAAPIFCRTPQLTETRPPTIRDISPAPLSATPGAITFL